MYKRYIIAFVALLLVAGGLIGFNLFRDKMIAGFFASMTPPAVTISTSTVEPITWEPGIETIGTALAGQGVDLSTEAAGVVREIPFAANERVEKGALLLQIDDRTERADLESAQASLALAKTELERAQALQARGVSSTNTLQTAQANGVQLSAGLPDKARGEYQTVLANILATPLRVLAPLLCAHVAPGGHLVLAGILERQADELKEAYAPWVRLEVADAEDGWILMTAQR